MELVREHINFKRGIDPKDAMNIGLRNQIIEWLEYYYHDISNATRAGTYIINDDLTIDIDGFFTTIWKENLPNYIQFNKIDGNFLFSEKQKVTSLKGCPKIVNGEFYCNSNDLKNLIGGPKIVAGNYICSLNPHIKSLEGLAKKIGGMFACNNKSGLTEKDIPEGTEISDLIRTNVSHWSDW